MIRIVFAVLSLLFLHGTATLAGLKTIKSNENDYDLSVEIELLDSGSVAGWQAINQRLPDLVMSDGCDPEEKDRQPIGYYMEANAVIEAISARYVSYRVSYSVYCGGAHPSHWLDFKTFDAVTGDAVNIAADIPVQDYDDPSYDYEKIEAQQLELAQIIIDHIEPTNDVFDSCPQEVSGAQQIAEFMYPYIDGLGKTGRVIINTSPPHVIAVCRFDVAVPFEAVARFFSSQNPVRALLAKTDGN